MFLTLSAPFTPRKPVRGASRALLATTLAPGLVLALSAAVGHAHDTPAPLHDVVSLSAEATADVDNDLMRATLAVQVEAAEPDALADEINTTMRWALDALEAYPGIERETRDYHTWPRRDPSREGRPIGWQGSQTLALESGDFAAMGEAIRTLQTRLQVQRTTFDVDRETRRAAADALIDEALEAFGRRASRIADKLGATGYEILDVDVRLGANGHAPPVAYRAEAVRAYGSSVAEPAFTAGSGRLEATATGRIRLERDIEGNTETAK